MRGMIAAAALLMLAGCGGEDPQPAKKAAAPETLPPGEYEVTLTTTSLTSADNSPLPASLKQGDRRVVRGCVGADGLPQPELLAAAGDQCELQNPFVRIGRLNFQLSCERPGQGKVMNDVTGTYTAEGFTGTLNASSFFAGTGDFRLTQEINARKVADQCSTSAGPGETKA